LLRAELLYLANLIESVNHAMLIVQAWYGKMQRKKVLRLQPPPSDVCPRGLRGEALEKLGVREEMIGVATGNAIQPHLEGAELRGNVTAVEMRGNNGKGTFPCHQLRIDQISGAHPSKASVCSRIPAKDTGIEGSAAEASHAEHGICFLRIDSGISAYFLEYYSKGNGLTIVSEGRHELSPKSSSEECLVSASFDDGPFSFRESIQSCGDGLLFRKVRKRYDEVLKSLDA